MEQRDQHLKKLSSFCSEVDRYQYCLPEIQERLAESLRLPQSPVVHEQIFLFFRVLILRISAQHLTSLWPTIFSEVVHVLLQMESDISSDAKSQKQRMQISELLLGTNGYVPRYVPDQVLGSTSAVFLMFVKKKCSQTALTLKTKTLVKARVVKTCWRELIVERDFLESLVVD